jgi:cell division protein FtsL
MLKLLLCLAVAVVTAACLMQLRQQRLELNHQTAQLHNQIESRQARLWNQQLQIAKVTAPPALHDTIGKNNLHLTPLNPVPAPLATSVYSPSTLSN